MSNPLEQFVIKPIIPLKAGDVDISFTNSSLFMLLAVAAAALLFSLCLRRRTIVPGLAQSLPECAYGFIANLMKENIGPEGLKYFSFIFSVFLFVAFGNILGLFPYAFTFTSHATAVGTLSIAALLFNVAVGIRKRKWGYLRTFMPRGIPLVLAPLVVPIEAISLLSKPFSLTVTGGQHDGGAHHAQDHCRFYRQSGRVRCGADAVQRLYRRFRTVHCRPSGFHLYGAELHLSGGRLAQPLAEKIIL